LKKIYGVDNIETITDEYGNKWFELELNEKRDLEKPILLDTQDTVRGEQDTYTRAKYFGEAGVTNSVTVLNDIAKSNHALKPLAQQLLPFAKENNIELRLVEDADFAGQYDIFSNTILINESALFRGKGVEPTILHEIIHSLSSNTLSNGNYPVFEMLYEKAKKELGTDYYALDNLDEFITGIFTDAKFINALKEVAPIEGLKEHKNLFTQLMDYILNLFNIFESNKSLYTQAFATATQVLENQRLSTIESNIQGNILSDNFSSAFNSIVDDSVFTAVSENELEEMRKTCN
jgi:hypothetical protein